MSIYFGQGPDAEVTPKSLYVLTATLIKHGLLTLDEIYPHVCIIACIISETYWCS